MRIEVEKVEVVAPRDFVSLGGLSRSLVDYVTVYFIANVPPENRMVSTVQ